MPKKKTERRLPVVLDNEGETIFGVLHLPAGKGLKPAVLLNHGFGGNKIGLYQNSVTGTDKSFKAAQ